MGARQMIPRVESAMYNRPVRSSSAMPLGRLEALSGMTRWGLPPGLMRQMPVRVSSPAA
jgi:hypothetical protein